MPFHELREICEEYVTPKHSTDTRRSACRTWQIGQHQKRKRLILLTDERNRLAARSRPSDPVHIDTPRQVGKGRRDAVDHAQCQQ